MSRLTAQKLFVAALLMVLDPIINLAGRKNTAHRSSFDPCRHGPSAVLSLKEREHFGVYFTSSFHNSFNGRRALNSQ